MFELHTNLNPTDKGQLFSWGCNEFGQTNPYESGRTFFEPRFVPLKGKLGRIKDVATGEMSTHVVNGELTPLTKLRFHISCV